MYMKKNLALLLVIISAFMLFSGCEGSQSDNEEKTNESSETTAAQLETTTSPADIHGKITFSSTRTDLENTYADYVKAFNEIFPNIEVEVVTARIYRNHILMALSANELPDFFVNQTSTITMDIMKDYCMPLNDVVEGIDKYDTSLIESWIDEKGNIYGLPIGTAAGGVVYNKKLFKEVGVDVPKTYSEFISVGKMIKDAGYIGLGIPGLQPEQLFAWTYYTPWAWVDIEKTPGWFLNRWVGTDTPFTEEAPIVKSYKMLRDVIDSGIAHDAPLEIDWEALRREFTSGKVGMIYTGEWYISQASAGVLTKEDVGFFPFPYDESGGPYKVLTETATAYSMSADSDYPEAAIAFYNWMFNENHDTWVKDEGVQFPARKGVKIDVHPAVIEFLNYDIIQVNPGQKEDWEKLYNTARIELDRLGQEVLAGKDVMELFEKKNKDWARARKELGFSD